jgi:hypothetical protein
LGTCQVPVPVLALPRWSSFPVRALAKCPYQYWQCRDGVHFQYGHLPSARTSIGIAVMEIISSTGTCQVPVPVLAWLFAAQTSEFYCTLGKIAIRKRTLVSSSMGTSTGIALPRTSIGNLRVWVPTYILQIKLRCCWWSLERT